jgi:hypothetical protein
VGTTTTSPTESLPTDSNTTAVPISVNAGVNSQVPNLPLVSVTLCAPGSTTNCVTIPNIQVDTGSVGLRVVNTAISSAMLSALPLVNNAAASPVGECAVFADGVAWGAVRSASVQLGSMTTTAPVSVQVFGDTSIGPIPSACSSAGSEEDTVATLGVNGIIGIGYFLQDCGSFCESVQSLNENPPIYYGCPSTSSCTATTLVVASQVSNPVASMPAPYNNGDVIQLPAVPSSGAAAANGYLVLGVNNAPDNMLGTATLLGLDNEGDLTVSFNSATFNQSFIDSGSSIFFFNDSAIAQCSSTDFNGFYCPASAFEGTASLMGNIAPINSYAFSFEIGNAQTLLDNATDAFAFDNLGGPETSSILSTTQTFDVGLPFFYGKSVYTLFEGQTLNGATGPAAAVGDAP